jgi:tRNA-dihydrouridine synthase
MRDATGARFAMVGRAALGDPWIFSGRRVSRGEAARFLVAYADTMQARLDLRPRAVASRVKQLLRHWTAGGLVPGETARTQWLREQDADALLGRLRSIAEEA